MHQSHSSNPHTIFQSNSALHTQRYHQEPLSDSQEHILSQEHSSNVMSPSHSYNIPPFSSYLHNSGNSFTLLPSSYMTPINSGIRSNGPPPIIRPLPYTSFRCDTTEDEKGYPPRQIHYPISIGETNKKRRLDQEKEFAQLNDQEIDENIKQHIQSTEYVAIYNRVILALGEYKEINAKIKIEIQSLEEKCETCILNLNIEKEQEMKDHVAKIHTIEQKYNLQLDPLNLQLKNRKIYLYGLKRRFCNID